MTQTQAETAIVPVWDLADRMTKALRESGIGVAEMAGYLGVSRDSIGRWINGRNEPKRAAVVAWAAITNIDLTWLETGQAPALELVPGPDSVRQQGLEPRTRWYGVKRPDLHVLAGGLTVNHRLTPNRPLHSVPTIALVVAS